MFRGKYRSKKGRRNSFGYFRRFLKSCSGEKWSIYIDYLSQFLSQFHNLDRNTTKFVHKNFQIQVLVGKNMFSYFICRVTWWKNIFRSFWIPTCGWSFFIGKWKYLGIMFVRQISQIVDPNRSKSLVIQELQAIG